MKTYRYLAYRLGLIVRRRIYKFSTIPNIVSATFEFTVTDPNTGVVHNITNGRFDSTFTQ